MIVLGIETSCDETAAAIVTLDKRILANVIHTQVDDHQPYGGVVPEIAARNHLAYLDRVIQKALMEAAIHIDQIDAIAVTAGPGLIGGVMVGVMAAKVIAASLAKPFVAVNHLEGHALTARLSNNVEFPFLLMLMSGGHCQILMVSGVGHYEVLGQTIDDAAGEAFDKVAKSLDLDYPGGPQVEKLALQGDPKRFVLPRPLKGRGGCDFSFAGLKTAARNIIMAGEVQTDQDKADLCAGFQEAVKDCLVDRLKNALAMISIEFSTVVLAGGVAANQYLRSALTEVCQSAHKEFVAPPLKLCTDNAVMIAWAGIEQLRLGKSSPLDFQPRPRWPLSELKGN